MKVRLFYFLFSFLGLWLSLSLIKQAVRYLSKAGGMPAKIVIDVATDQGTLIPIWQALAQGGEEKYPFSAITDKVSNLQPRYIRVDHIFDAYNLVKKEEAELILNWTELDTLVDQILKTGARPFFSLSYMPPALAKDGQITNPPVDWNDWSRLVQATIQHYSGKNDRNLNEVIYEVWNEPDLFGGWKIGGEKDYRQLYRYAVNGAGQVQNVNDFEIGGPAITAPYQNWLNGFLDYVADNRLRLDFYSWHRYTLEPEDFLKDINQVDTWLFQNSGYSLKKYLTEWSLDSENSFLNDTGFAAAHLVATIRQLLQRLDLAFIFEIKDGLDPAGKKYWGRWGLLTHENAGGVEKKPKYKALELLNKMKGNRLRLEGEGTWVTGFASKKEKQILMILTNLDPQNQHLETVPLTFINLENGQYAYKESDLAGQEKSSSLTVNNGSLSKEIYLGPNRVILVQLLKI